MTITTIQQRIHILLEKDTDYPVAGDEDYTVRLGLINDAKDVWKEEMNIADTAIVSATPAVAGTGYVVGDILTVNSGYINATVEVSSVSSVGAVLEVEITNGGSGYAAGTYAVTGGTGSACTLAVTIPSDFTTGTDVLPMADPQFVIYWVLSELTSDEDVTLSSKYLQIAQEKLNKMVSERVDTVTAQDMGDGFGI